MLIDTLKRQFGRYRKTAKQFVGVMLTHYRRQVGAVLVFASAATVLQLGAFGVIFLYLRTLETGGVVSGFGFSFSPRTSPGLLFAAVTAVALMLAAASFAKYAASVISLEIGKLYEIWCVQQGAILFRHLPPVVNGIGRERYRSPLLQTYPRLAGRVARISAGVTLPILMMMASTLFLLYLDVQLTLIVLLIGLAALPMFYFVNVKGARASLAFETSTPASTRERWALSEMPEHDLHGNGRTDPVANAFRRGALNVNMSSYIQRFRAVDESTLISSLATAIALTVIIGMKGSEILMTREGWSDLFIFLIVLRLAAGSLMQIGQIITSVNRFYLQIAQYFDALAIAEEERRTAPPASADETAEQIPPPTPTWTLPAIGRGMAIRLSVPPDSSEEHARALLGFLFPQHARNDTIDWRAMEAPVDSDTVRRRYGLSEDTGPDALLTALSTFRLDGSESQRIADGLDRPIAELDNDISDYAHCVLSLIAARQSGKKLLVLPGSIISNIGFTKRQRLFQRAKSMNIVALASPSGSEYAREGEALSIVAGDTNILAIGDPSVLKARHRDLQKLLTGTANGELPIADGDMELEEQA